MPQTRPCPVKEAFHCNYRLINLNTSLTTPKQEKYQDGGVQRSRRVLQNWHGHSRQIQSLHSLHNTMLAQLATAEQLSGCLSKQMAALSIESSGKHDVKKKLFESIGLSYAGGTEKSPARPFSTPSSKEHQSTSGSIAAKEQSRRNQVSFAKSYEPETARRRRDSLDHSWTRFDPPKTTVQRMLKED
ncbi:hypothetical protein CDL12_26272 [Handroanthus impetiginosus]|uniref:Uncharacterized protein n=1 Tax=Handroanthus impetiginosus TaxID=429701 RepID=A0A2G9G7E6_9LAMI|nr:hypothetical protein CDL12_26272 [Handroanthus impetiginosus]